jgi:hypothetical protein
MRQFNSAAKRAASVENPVPVEFEINGTVLEANPPTSGQLAVFLAAQASGDGPEVAKSMLELLWAVLGEENYRWLEMEMKAGAVDVELVEEVIEYLGEVWSSRPTSPASVSSPSRTSTGKRSTATSRTKASTRST